MTPVRHFLIFTLCDLISEFRLLFIEYLIAKSLRDGSSRGERICETVRRGGGPRVKSGKSCSQAPCCINARDPGTQEIPVT